MAMHHVHSHNILHRDLKTSNILICGKGPNKVLKIADFGISKLLSTKTKAETVSLFKSTEISLNNFLRCRLSVLPLIYLQSCVKGNHTTRRAIYGLSVACWQRLRV